MTEVGAVNTPLPLVITELSWAGALFCLFTFGWTMHDTTSVVAIGCCRTGDAPCSAGLALLHWPADLRHVGQVAALQSADIEAGHSVSMLYRLVALVRGDFALGLASRITDM